MPRMQTLTGSPYFNAPPTGRLDANDATAAFVALLHQRHAAINGLHDVGRRIETFIETLVQTDRRAASRLRVELGRHIAEDMPL
jgi:hypothetical protein